MTDTPTAAVPAVMTSRQRTAPSPAGASQDAGRLSVELSYAQEIAKAGDMLPPSYRNKPGAVLLVNQWAQKHEVDILTAMQTVAFIHGKPVIDATMQRALAERAGYRVKVLDEECSDQAAKVEVWRDGDLLGAASYTMEHARQAGLATKDGWKKNPGDMLVARATTRAIRRHAPGVLIGLAVGDEIEQADPVAVLVSESEPETNEPTAPEPEATPDIVDAEIAEAPEPDEPSGPDPITVDTLKVRLRSLRLSQGDAIAKAREVAAERGIEAPNAVAAIVANSDLMAAVTAWLDEQ